MEGGKKKTNQNNNNRIEKQANGGVFCVGPQILASAAPRGAGAASGGGWVGGMEAGGRPRHHRAPAEYLALVIR